MSIKNDIESILVGEEELEQITTRLAAEITEDYKDSPRKLLLLSILKGSLTFTADLMRKIPLPLDIDFMKVSSYGASTISSGQLKIYLDLKRDDLTDVDIIIIEDIRGKNISTMVVKIHFLSFFISSNC